MLKIVFVIFQISGAAAIIRRDLLASAVSNDFEVCCYNVWNSKHLPAKTFNLFIIWLAKMAYYFS